MTFAIRCCNEPDDYPRMAEIVSTGSWEPASANDFTAPFPAEGIRQRLVAVAEGGQVVGYGSVFRLGYEEPGLFTIKVTTDPAWRRQGAGSALLGALEAWAREQGATRFLSKFRDDDPAFLAFALHHGYVEEGHHLGGNLNVQAFDEAPWADVVPRLEDEGIRFVDLVADPDEGLVQSLYELERDAMHDEPGCEDEVFPPFESWRADTLVPGHVVIVAADGPKAVAMTHISGTGEKMRTHFTGVGRGYRGRNLALAVKLLVIRAAKDRGATWITTGSDSRNTPMLTINRKLGYVYRPGMYVTCKY